jgi:hypothetical protein
MSSPAQQSAAHLTLAKIRGVGPDVPIEADEKGYRSSPVPYRFDLMPGDALLHMAAIMAAGADSHGANNWRKGNVDNHLNKAMVHVFAYLAGDTSDNHVGHAAWRMMAALEVYLQDERAAGREVAPIGPIHGGARDSSTFS